MPLIEVKSDGRRSHVFLCARQTCSTRIRRYLDGPDRSSTSNLAKHARSCYGHVAVDEALKGKTGNEGTIATAFGKKGVKTYSTRNMTDEEIRYVPSSSCPDELSSSMQDPTFSIEVVKWVTSNMRPFSIVSDPGFLKLMKTGRPHIKIPSKSTVARDVSSMFKRAQGEIKTYLEKHAGRVHISTDTWTSPNHKAFMALVAHLEIEGDMQNFLLDFVEVAFVSYLPR